MKTKIYLIGCLCGLSVLSSCTDEFLKPDALSFFEPSKTFTTKEGLESALASCDKQMRLLFFNLTSGDGACIASELMFSDLGVNGSTDKPTATGSCINVDVYLTPTGSSTVDNHRWSQFWNEGYSGIKYANTIITNIDKVEGLDPALRNEMLGRAYFHRAWRYFNLIFQFKDIPLLTREVQGPKFDYQSTKRSVILDMITKDLEFAVQNVPETAEYGGMVTKGACRQLLIKCYLSQGNFDKAIEEADILIDKSGYALMKEPFGTFVNQVNDIHPVTRNIIWDLHRPENKMISENKEMIHCIISRYGTTTGIRLQNMRNFVPMWSAAGSIGIMTPDGKQGMDISKEQIDYRKAYGRGIAKLRPTTYFQYGLWLNDKTDLRHNAEVGNWMTMERLKYNHPNLFKTGSQYAGKNLQLYDDKGKLLCSDTIRNWFNWPQYKTWMEDISQENATNYDGGEGDWYVYRLAETYLLRAEAYMWKGEKQKAADDVNEIRKRAKCSKLFNADEMNIGVIMDERARELYLEEWRHVELSRVSYIFALTGQADEFGQTYTEDGLSDNSYWWQRICKYNDFYNKGIKTRSNVEYTISPYHIFYPVPQSSIDGNREGIINQNKGYAGYEYNIPPFDNLEAAMASEIDYGSK